MFILNSGGGTHWHDWLLDHVTGTATVDDDKVNLVNDDNVARTEQDEEPNSTQQNDDVQTTEKA